jgi:hypothetical protein
MPTVMYMVQLGHVSCEQLSKLWDYDEWSHEKYYLFTSGTITHMIKEYGMKYKEWSNLYDQDPATTRFMLSADSLYMIKEGHLKFEQMKKWFYEPQSKLFAMLNGDVMYYVREGLTNYTQFEKWYDGFLYKFEPIVWKYFLHANILKKFSYEYLVAAYEDNPCKFQEFVMQENFGAIESAVHQKMEGKHIHNNPYMNDDIDPLLHPYNDKNELINPYDEEADL